MPAVFAIMPETETKTSFQEVVIAIIFYSFCSSTLLLANKMVLADLPLPSFVSFVQMTFTVALIYILSACGVKIDAFEWSKVKPYAFYVVAFVFAIYTNMKALSYSNIETVIVFRSCTPISTCMVEYFLMGRDLPSFRSAMSLAVVAGGAVMYCLSDSEFAMNGIQAYYWVSIYFLLMTFEMTYGKRLTSSNHMDSVWGSVKYCNVLAVLPMYALGHINGEYDDIENKLKEVPANGMLLLVFSCFVGALIGYSGWNCRALVSGTSYALVGVVNKFFTVFLNVILWDKHSSNLGLCAVCVCLCAGFFYQQAPMREESKTPPTKAQQSEA